MTKKVPVEVVKNARTLTFLVLVCSQLFYSLSLRSSKKPFYQIKIFSNNYLNGAILLGLVLQLSLLFIPFLRNAFKLHLPDLNGWLMALALGLIPFIAMEISKIILMKRK